MSALQFDFRDILNEIDALSALAMPFIALESRRVLSELKGTLDTYRYKPTERPISWEISEDRPLNTIVSNGEYEPGGGGTHHVFASLSSIWEIRRIPPRRKSLPAESFELVGKTSTRVRIFDGDAELAMWRMEIGDSQAPGCHFHVQVRSEDDAPFPSSLSVPRLPSIIVTPPAVLEYVLGELFQDRWYRRLFEASGQVKPWASIQRKRLEALLKWHLEIVSKPDGSPWPTLKRERPPSRLFAP